MLAGMSISLFIIISLSLWTRFSVSQVPSVCIASTHSREDFLSFHLIVSAAGRHGKSERRNVENESEK